MMYLIPEPVAITPSPSRPSPSPHPESLHSQPKSRRRCCFSKEDDSRDRQFHWKRLKTRLGKPHRGSSRTLIWSPERDPERSPPRSRVQAPWRTNPRPCHRVIVLKGEEPDAGLLRCCSEGQGWDMPDDVLLRGDGGAASPSQAMYPTLKNESMTMLLMSTTVGDATRSSSMMCERSRVEHMARRAPGEKGPEVRVCGREAWGEGVSFGDSRRHADDDSTIPARMGADALNRRIASGESMNRESSRGFGDHPWEGPMRARMVEFELSGGGNGKGGASHSGTGEGREHGQRLGNRTAAAAAAAAGVEAKERDMESERWKEKRERWAEKERDLETELEKENSMSQMQTKAGVTAGDYSHKFTVAKAPFSASVRPVEVDPHRLCQRQKQIDYGKNTLGYERYTESVPRYQRTEAHPRTPDIRQVCSKRSWDGQIRKWRRLLHEYDPPKREDEEDPELMFAPTTDQERTTAEDSPVDMQSEFVEDPDLKIYGRWSDEEC